MALKRQPALASSKALAKAASTERRLTALIPVLAAIDSPLGEYLATAAEVGAVTGNITAPSIAVSQLWQDPVTYTSQVVEWWTAPAPVTPEQVPDPGWSGAVVTSVLVECIGGGGGGGGGGGTPGAASYGGGGGGGGEYSGFLSYPVVPGRRYTVVLGQGGSPGFTNAAGGDGSATVFDPQGAGLSGGVVALGGKGGGTTGVGQGGAGGMSAWSSGNYPGAISADATAKYTTEPDISCTGGGGGTEVGGVGTDSPAVIGVSATTQLWWPLADYDPAWPGPGSHYTPPDVTAVSDHSGHGRAGTVVQNSDAVATGANGITTDLAWQQDGDGSWSPGGTTVAPEAAVPQFTSATEFPGSALWLANTYSPVCARVQCGTVFTLAPAAFTVSCWVASDPAQPDWGSTGTPSVLVTNNNGTGAGPALSGGWSLYLDSANRLSLIACNSGTSYTVTAPSAVPSDGSWHQLVATFHSGTITLYTDGAQVATGTTGALASPAATTTPVTLGCYPGSSIDVLGGYMANVWIAETAVSAGEVATAFGTSVPPTGGAGGGAGGGSLSLDPDAGLTWYAAFGAPGAVATGGAGGAAAAAYAPSATANPALADLAPISPVLTGSSAGGAGGAAGSAGATGATAAPWGGGGGGAGFVSAPAYQPQSLTVPALASASFCGIDADGGNGGKLYTTSIAPQAGLPDPYPAASATGTSLCYQGGTSSASYNGTMLSVVAFSPLSAILGASGAAPVPVALSLTLAVQSTGAFVLGVWASGQPFFGADGTQAAPEVPLVLTDAMMTTLSPEFAGAYYIPPGTAGRSVTLSILTAPLAAAVIAAGAATTLLLGPLPGFSITAASALGSPIGSYSGDTAADWYGQFTGAASDGTGMTLALAYVPGGGPGVSAGAGAQGYCAISEVADGEVITAMQSAYAYAAAASPADLAGDQVPVGLAARLIQTWTPGVSPAQVEAWNNVGASGSGAAYTLQNGWQPQGGGNPCRFKKMPDGSVWLQFTVSGAVKTSNTLFQLPAGYRPPVQQQLPVATYGGGATTAIGNLPYVQVNTDGTMVLTNPWPWSANTIVNGFISVL